MAARLAPHIDTPCDAVERIEVEAARRGEGLLELEYRLFGDLARLRLPAPGAGVRADGLWRHTCFEAFVRAGDGSAGYLEINLAPSGAWAAYRFAGYREGMIEALAAPPAIACDVAEDRLTLVAAVALDAETATQELHLGLSAVVEDVDGRISYWAMRHAPGKPDFHHPDSFALVLPAEAS